MATRMPTYAALTMRMPDICPACHAPYASHAAQCQPNPSSRRATRVCRNQRRSRRPRRRRRSALYRPSRRRRRRARTTSSSATTCAARSTITTGAEASPARRTKATGSARRLRAREPVAMARAPCSLRHRPCSNRAAAAAAAPAAPTVAAARAERRRAAARQSVRRQQHRQRRLPLRHHRTRRRQSARRKSEKARARAPPQGKHLSPHALPSRSACTEYPPRVPIKRGEYYDNNGIGLLHVHQLLGFDLCAHKGGGRANDYLGIDADVEVSPPFPPDPPLHLAPVRPAVSARRFLTPPPPVPVAVSGTVAGSVA